MRLKRAGFRTSFATLLAVMAGCASPPEPAAEEAPPPVAEPLNTLTPEESEAGWRLLFDGRSLDQWRGYRMEEVPASWQVQDGAVYFDASHGDEGLEDLTSREQFSDFELRLEWKISPGGNSGVFFRVAEDHEQEYITGPEVQIIDESEGHFPGLEETQKSGANYGLHPPAVEAVRPAGEWNHLHLTVDGSYVSHWLNGEKVVEYELWTDEWKEMVAATKFADWPDYGMRKSGHIVLQDHGAPVWFRNIKIRPLN